MTGSALADAALNHLEMSMMIVLSQSPRQFGACRRHGVSSDRAEVIK